MSERSCSSSFVPFNNSDDPALTDVPEKSAGDATTSRATVLKKLGKTVSESKKTSEAANDLIAARWSEIARKGLAEKDSTDIVALYPTPGNTPAWDPPKLNPELKSNMQDSTSARDSRIVTKQTKLAACLTITAKVVGILIDQESTQINDHLLSLLADAGSLLADLHHDDSCIRRNLVLANMNASVKKVLADADITELLFGDKLEEAVKSAKTLAASMENPRPQQFKNSTKQRIDSNGSYFHRSKNSHKGPTSSTGQQSDNYNQKSSSRRS